jgi:hypothetical protein
VLTGGTTHRERPLRVCRCLFEHVLIQLGAREMNNRVEALSKLGI